MVEAEFFTLENSWSTEADTLPLLRTPSIYHYHSRCAGFPPTLWGRKIIKNSVPLSIELCFASCFADATITRNLCGSFLEAVCMFLLHRSHSAQKSKRAYYDTVRHRRGVKLALDLLGSFKRVQQSKHLQKFHPCPNHGPHWARLNSSK